MGRDKHLMHSESADLIFLVCGSWWKFTICPIFDDIESRSPALRRSFPP